MEFDLYFKALLFLFMSFLIYKTEPSQNIALGKNARQSTTNPTPDGKFVAERAVDGSINQEVFNANYCTHTYWVPKQTIAWWQVDLGFLSDIKSVKIYYRQNVIDYKATSRLDGFQVVVSSTSENWITNINTPCYSDKAGLPYPEDVVLVPCVDSGNFVTIYNRHYPIADANDGPILELCEVQVNGCERGKYGTDCSRLCSSGCLLSACDPDDGHCIYGCKSGRNGRSCEKSCDDREFGNNCASTCYCKNGGCDNVNGICTNPGCEAGWKGGNCSTACNATTFGEDCATTCHCYRDGCNSYNGNCTYNKCKPGWMTASCSTTCLVTTFGEDCKRRCFCAKSGCHHVTGVCNGTECLAGWNGTRCDIPCQGNTFGPNCINQCHCLTEMCSNTNGTCTVSGCKDGWRGETCSEACAEKRFGRDCISTCHCKSEGCDRFNGICKNPDCDDGWKGQRCDEACKNGTYGYNCSRTCNCSVGSCNYISGECDTLECQKGSRGVSCSKDSVESEQSGPESNRINVVQIVIAIAAVILIEATILAIFLLIRRKRRNQKRPDKLAPKYSDLVERGQDNIEETQYDEIKNIEPQNSLKTKKKSVYDNYEDMSDSINPTLFEVKNLKTVCLQSKTNGDFDNQFKSFNKGSGYVVIEGPRENTIDDFWRMIWQTKCGTIVLLTNLIENEKVQCAKYWPEFSESMVFDDLEVTLDTDSENLYFSQKVFKVTQVNTKEDRRIQHFHFTAWANYGTPNPLQLMLFYQRYIRIQSEQTGATAIHSGGDIGRSGTFIALDAIYKEGQKTEEVDVLNFLRRYPIKMIQTKEQYVLLHETLAEVFQFKDTAHKKEIFRDSIYENDRDIKDEFKWLNQSKPVFDQTDAYRGASQKENQSKNRNKSILPVDRYRPYLMSNLPTRTDFINAVILPSFREHAGFLATQYPLIDTVVDLWCMVYDHDSSTVVTLDKLQKSEEEVEWFPRDSKELLFGPFTVGATGKQVICGAIKETELGLRFKDKEREVKLLQYQGWESKNDIPASTNGILKLIEMVNNWKQAGEKGPITVICSDGSKCCGLFCLLYNVIQSLGYEDSIDIFQSARLLQSRRPELFPSIEQYRFCYRAVHGYLDSAHVYYN